MTHSRLGNTSSTPAVRPGQARAWALTATATLTSWRALLPTAGLTALLVYLAITPLPPFAADPYGSLTRRYAVLGALLVGYVGWLIAQRRLPRRSVFDLPLAAVTLAVLVAVGGSIDPRLSLEHVLPLLPTLVLFYVLHDVVALDGRRLAWAVLLAVAVVAVFALASVWRSLDDWWTLVRAVDGGLSRATLLPPSTPRVADVGNHPNVLAAVLAMALPAALLLWTENADRRVRAVVVLAAFLIAAALFFTLSRAAWAGAIAGLVVTVGGYVVAGRGRIHAPRWVWVVLIAVALVIALAALWLLASGARPEWLFRDSLGPRADMRRAGWEMFLDNPLTGAGPGLYVALYPLYGGAYPFAAVHSHNIVVQTALDTGLLGLLAGGLLLVAILVVVVRGLRSAGRTSRHLTAVAAGMLAAGLVHALADSPQLFPEVQALGVVALVMLTRSVEPAPGTGPASLIPLRLAQWLPRSVRVAGWSGPALAVLLAVVLPVAWLVTSRAHLAHSESVALAGEGRWPEAVAAAERAVARDERMAAYWSQLGAAHAAAAIDGDRRAEQQAALDALRRGLELEPHNGAALVNYAALSVVLDRPEVAREALPAL
ncbi:MAG: O-antigen ligase family protein, partial [Dehalococcoidia bacterium]